MAVLAQCPTDNLDELLCGDILYWLDPLPMGNPPHPDFVLLAARDPLKVVEFEVHVREVVELGEFVFPFSRPTSVDRVGKIRQPRDKPRIKLRRSEVGTEVHNGEMIQE